MVAAAGGGCEAEEGGGAGGPEAPLSPPPPPPPFRPGPGPRSPLRPRRDHVGHGRAGQGDPEGLQAVSARLRGEGIGKWGGGRCEGLSWKRPHPGGGGLGPMGSPPHTHSSGSPLCGEGGAGCGGGSREGAWGGHKGGEGVPIRVGVHGEKG